MNKELIDMLQHQLQLLDAELFGEFCNEMRELGRSSR